MQVLSVSFYDPAIGRFISADGYVSTGQGPLSFNMFAYCGNNPISRIDNNGYFFKTIETVLLKIFEAAVESLHLEIGFGYGLGVSKTIYGVDISAEAYHDAVTLGLNDNNTFTAISGGAEIGAEIGEVALKISSSYEHRYETGNQRTLDGHNTASSPLDVYNCPKTTKEPLKLEYPLHNYFGVDTSDELFVGAKGGFHFGLGFHYIAGWDVNEFIYHLNS